MASRVTEGDLWRNIVASGIDWEDVKGREAALDVSNTRLIAMVNSGLTPEAVCQYLDRSSSVVPS